MVPGSTLIYGSSLSMVTFMPRVSRIAASDAEAIPLPRELTTPPVTKIYLVMVSVRPHGAYSSPIARGEQFINGIERRRFRPVPAPCAFLRQDRARSQPPYRG